jgi:hypothetical protein
MTASHLFSFGLLLRRKDGRTIRFDDQSQIFYDRNGNVRAVYTPSHHTLRLPGCSTRGRPHN